MFVAYKPKVNTDSKILSLQPHLVISRLVDESTYVEHLYTNLLTFLLTKHLSDYDNFFLKDFSYSKSAMCSTFSPIYRCQINTYDGEANVIELNGSIFLLVFNVQTFKE